MQEKLWRIRKWMSGGTAPPKSIELIPTNRCNQNCLTCWRQGAGEMRYDHEMSDERLIRLVEEAAQLGVYEFAFVGGGEPLARPVTLQLISRIKELGMHGDLVTNGTLFTERQTEGLVRIGWDRIKFSVDSADEKTYDYLRGMKGGFRLMERNLLLFWKYKRKIGSELPRIGFNFVVSKESYKGFPGIILFAQHAGCNEILLLPMTVFSEKGGQLKMNDTEIQEFREVIKKMIPVAERAGISSNMHEFLDERLIRDTNEMDRVMMEMNEIDYKKIKSKQTESGKMESREHKSKGVSRERLDTRFLSLPCYMPWHHVTIIADGRIAPCFNEDVWSTDVTVKEHSLREVWYGDYFDRFRRQLLSRRLGKRCATCCVWRVFENRDIRENLKVPKKDEPRCTATIKR